jgi:hypothetical protein
MPRHSLSSSVPVPAKEAPFADILRTVQQGDAYDHEDIMLRIVDYAYGTVGHIPMQTYQDCVTILEVASKNQPENSGHTVTEACAALIRSHSVPGPYPFAKGIFSLLHKGYSGKNPALRTGRSSWVFRRFLLAGRHRNLCRPTKC